MPTLLLLRAAALLSLLVLLVSFASAGQLLSGAAALRVHQTGAVVLHVTTGLAALAAGLHWRAARGPLWPVALAVVVFAVTFAQAWTGSHLSLAVHVPAALVTTVGVVWLAAWAVTGAAARTGTLAR